MIVDRARFLLLTTALSAAGAVAASAAGCTVKSADTGTPNPGPINEGYDAAADQYTVDSSTEDGGACLDDTGAAASCAGAKIDCMAKCESYLPNYKKGVARSIASCIVALPSCEGNENAVLACVQTALGQACPDPSAEGYCDTLVASCDGSADGGVDGGATPPLEKMECYDLASALNTTGRAAFTSCLNEGITTANYCKADPTSCIDQIE